ncbi:phosphate acyltransferase [Planotetraspora sp. A-T 1434]|uniref:phosphate acyltransferase n=1 Tax=Planotetraspora sp. A-T 1434 TaxID=2979219 RepID=UPI0021C1C662|nr:phosphate acyltransferase [Planotetraspora sp. A-T 1434]MCT9933306.1 phosphate acyltransferase [Planotetraspora sp. A-T 1434]
MRRRIRLAVDAVGGDLGPGPVVEGALRLADRYEIVLVGSRDELSRAAGGRFAILDAPERVAMDDDPIAVTRAKRRSSLMVAAGAVAGGFADGMVTTGNTGAAVLAAAVRMRRAPGVLNPALATLLPAPGASPTVLLDVGAATECPASWLVQFAELGAAYARLRLGVDRPRIGLLSNGEETVKGGPVQRSADVLIAALPERVGRYVGHVEAYELFTGRVDVVVCEGLTGDITLKTYERTLDATAEVALAAIRATLGDAAKPVTSAVSSAIRAQLAAEPGAVLLGVRGVCVVAHGAANGADVAGAIQVAATCVELNVAGQVPSWATGAPSSRATAVAAET